MYNPYLVIPFATWLIAQTLKFSLAAFRGKLDFKYFYASGGMPSVHSAVVCSLAITALLLDGAQSQIFGLSALFAAIVMYDSFGVRRASGEQAAALNMLIQSLDNDRVKLHNPDLKLREVLGHTPMEVTAGAALGLFLGALFNLSLLQTQLDWLASQPARLELIAYAALFALLVVGGIVAKVVMRRRYPDSAAIRSLAKQIMLKTQVIGWTGLLLAFAAYEKLSYLAWRLWPLLVIVGLIIWDIALINRYWRKLPEALADEAENSRRKKWLQMPTKRGKKRAK